jgi:hypothetical protein
MHPMTVLGYEKSKPRHRGKRIGIARHDKCAPFACNGTLALRVEVNPLNCRPDHFLITERCQGCGKVVNVYSVRQEPLPVNNDDVVEEP